MAGPHTHLQRADVIRHYMAGKSVDEVSRIVGVSPSYIYVALRDAGIERRGRGIPEPDGLLEAYHAGASVKALANRYGFARSVVVRFLRKHGVTPRDRSEGMQQRWENATDADKAAMVDAAHAASRGRKQSDSERRAIAAAKRGRPFSDTETRMRDLLAGCGVPAEMGVPLGRYNLDLTVSGPIAVELFGGGWHAYGRHLARFSERSRHVFDAGYHLVVVWVNPPRDTLGIGAAEQVVRLREFAESNPAAPRQYWVVRGAGDLVSAREDDGDEVPLIKPSGSAVYAGPRD